jgi:ABC-type multidrug transport system ATPase subunit
MSLGSVSITVDNISKSYGDVLALDDFSFNVKKGELFGLIGPDGAGKSTLFRILTTLLIQDKGNATVDGFDVVKDYKKLRQIIGYMPGRFSLYPDLTVEENLRFFATIFDTTIEDNYDLIKRIYSQIEPFKKRLAGNLSGGMKQKLALSCALIHKPQVLFLDEPTTGVDAVSRKEFWEMLKELQNKDITILVSTPYMDEASLCDRVALIQKGKILEIETPEKIVQSYPNPLWSVKSSDMYHLENDLQSFNKAVSVYRFGDSIHLTVNDENIKGEDIERFLQNRGQKNIKIKRTDANIEDCFMALMNSEDL